MNDKAIELAWTITTAIIAGAATVIGQRLMTKLLDGSAEEPREPVLN